MRHKEYLTEAGVPDAERDACMLWAFGANWEGRPVSQSSDLWNERHGDLFEIKGTQSRRDGMIAIGKAYLEYGRSE